MGIPQIFTITNSWYLGKFCAYTSGGTVGTRQPWQNINGYDVVPTQWPESGANMSATGVYAWSNDADIPDVEGKGVSYTALLEPATAKKFIIANLMLSDLVVVGVGEGKYDSIADIVDFHIGLVVDILIGDKGISPTDILYCTALPISPATYGAIDWTNLTYKAATEANVNHNNVVAMNAVRSVIEPLGCYWADTLLDSVTAMANAQAVYDFYMDADMGMHTSTKRGSMWMDTFMKPYFRKWLA